MKKNTFIFTMFCLLLGTLNSNAQGPVLGTTFNFDNSYATNTTGGKTAWAGTLSVANYADGFGFIQPATGWTPNSAVSPCSWLQGYLTLGAPGNDRTTDDAWFTYTSTGLTSGNEYEVEFMVAKSQGNDATNVMVHAWSTTPPSTTTDYVTNNKLATPAVAGTTFVSYKGTVVADATTMTFGFGVGLTGTNWFSKYRIQSIKVTDLGAAGVTSTETDIATFTLSDQTSDATIDTGAHTAAIEVTNGTSLVSLTPTITLSSGATVSPLSGVVQDFSGGAVNYTVTAEDGTTTQIWAVTVTEAPASTETDITGFTLSDQTGAATIDAGAHTVAIEVTNGTALTSLTPTITLSTGATVSPLSGATQNFSGGAVNYTVTAQDGTTTQIWAVTVTEAPAASNGTIPLDITFDDTYAADTSDGKTAWSGELSGANFANGFGFINPGSGWSTGSVSPCSWLQNYLTLGSPSNGNTNADEEAWFTYTADGLTIGVSYKMEVSVVRSQGRSDVDHNLHAWSSTPPTTTDGIASTSPLYTTTTGSLETQQDIEKTFVADATTMTFGVGIGRDGTTDMFNKTRILNMKITEVSVATKTTTGAGDWSTSIWGGTAPTAIDNVAIDHAVTISSSADVNNLTINSGGSLTVLSGGTLIVNGTSTGNVTYERNLTFDNTTNAHGWHLVSAPFTGQAYNDTWVTNNDIIASTTPGKTDNRGIATYTTANNTWAYHTLGAAATFGTGTGYSVKRGTNSGDVNFTGSVNTDNVTGVAVSTAGSGYNLLGNPYSAYYNSGAFLTNNSNLDDQIWIFDSANRNYLSKASGIAFKLAPGQGFFVKANTGTTVDFAENLQSHTGDLFQKSSKNELRLNITDGTDVRFAQFYFTDNATSGYDKGYEGKTFEGIKQSLDLYSQLVADNDGTNFQVQSLGNSDLEGIIIPLGLIAKSGSEISFSLDALNLPEGIKIYLEDREANVTTELNTNNHYKVLINSDSKDIGRFYLHTSNKTLSTDVINIENVSIYKTNTSTLRIVGLSQGKTSIKLFNILGKQVLNSSFTTNGIEDITLPKLAKGIYIVQLETAKGKLNKKIILE